ncbi:MAG: rRNA maturation RNase YbeY [Candidatus Taylorbacteria bacterium RIFCSPLOWO2_12_FULL_43_20]|uniref:Endoribonuclease YbeY n=1 Tax=Candidatus Taylorbacteria bacterium RIFCSPLOWO2_12_FULL_43_20 TaxID=1802332 RepID=A0A1G2P1G9_9BACT|nr:MAG: rRNA maturation RNase YbeY [Candidatus Taylorbacteria bacterium RIFCSPHIGHO2_01_FULL_43_120]OHA23091.1 MAG: rRNA maturation RNase YbeY [Candidatus Taylorbacteria bacterium RIFCSPHIGHO2_02_FULL_43_55]OHA28928.1 MAG: rRNA maturation RNase YbeY [Candidatus Taylorbacteria bacterium RIFCSPHIGHO2_12_FULL_42_34]OHA30912.1 MAG: rRNA maturation RNase YbeY [Candidatus Taylorbacteria bacterium RIFCSPLOWO2_01_FULL_43_83]OHA39294.1 MAG: rRNA maturation RNase YbeY [Candidatus Taylorbacteria bacterium
MSPFSDNFQVTNTTKGKLPRLPFLQMKNAVLGKKYSLSLVFTDNKLSRKLNLKFRNKNKPANILSFALEKNLGEIFLDLTQVRCEAPEFERSYTNFAAFLFIHGLMHLKGFVHSSKMEDEEKKIRSKFGV